MDSRDALIAALIDPLRVEPNRKVVLGLDFDPGYKPESISKEDGEALLESGVQLLSEYQERLAAQDSFAVLLCLQAMDAAGKDGTIKHVMSGVNPQGVHVHSFKAPSADELDHDFLWRTALRLPARGEIGIFNRSHYEEVLVVRVHPEFLDRQRLPDASGRQDVWKRRYRAINDWERYLSENGIVVVKVFLNVSKEEQRRRFLARINEPAKNWKLSVSDAQERRHWDEYQLAYSEMLSHTSTEWAPWYVVPADRKWFARICVSAILTHTLMTIDPRFPVLDADKLAELARVRTELEGEAG